VRFWAARTGKVRVKVDRSERVPRERPRRWKATLGIPRGQPQNNSAEREGVIGAVVTNKGATK
jgi:hypothetical protein